MPRYCCKVMETKVTHRVKTVVVEADNISMVHRFINHIHGEAAQMAGWQEDPSKGQQSHNVMVQGLAGPEHGKLETIVIEVPELKESRG